MALVRERKGRILDVHRADLDTAVPAVSNPNFPSVWQTIRNYVLWSYERGSIHYDVMVTLILLFVFFSPFFVNFKDKPVERTPHPSGVVVLPDGHSGFIYQIEASAISGKDDATIRRELLRVIEPIAGEVSIAHYKKARDASGRLTYQVWVQRL